MSEPKRYALAICNDLRNPGPYCCVSNLHTIEIVGAEPNECVAIEMRGLGVLVEKYGPGHHKVNIPSGKIRAMRSITTGDSKISVFGWG